MLDIVCWILKIEHEVLLRVEVGMSYFTQALHQTCVNGEETFKNVHKVKCKYDSMFNDVRC